MSLSSFDVLNIFNGFPCFIHKCIAFWGELVVSLVSEEMIRIPPFSPLHVSIVWEFVFSICPWSVGSRKMGWSRLQMLSMGIAKRRPALCSHCWPWIKWGGKLPSLCCNRYTLSYANARRDMQQPQQAQTQNCSCPWTVSGIAAHSWGKQELGDAGSFQLNI